MKRRRHAAAHFRRGFTTRDRGACSRFIYLTCIALKLANQVAASGEDGDELGKTMQREGELQHLNQMAPTSFAPAENREREQPFPVPASEKQPKLPTPSERHLSEAQISVVNNQSNMVFNDPSLTTEVSYETSTSNSRPEHTTVATSFRLTTESPQPETEANSTAQSATSAQETTTIEPSSTVVSQMELASATEPTIISRAKKRRPVKKRKRKPNSRIRQKSEESAGLGEPGATMISYRPLPGFSLTGSVGAMRRPEFASRVSILGRAQPVLVNLNDLGQTIGFVQRPPVSLISSASKFIPIFPQTGATESFMFDASHLPAGSLAASSLFGEPSGSASDEPEGLTYPEQETGSAAVLGDSFGEPAKEKRENKSFSSPSGELSAFGSQPPSEFETTLKQLPADGERRPEGLVPIEMDTSSEASAPSGSSSPPPPPASSEPAAPMRDGPPKGDDESDEDEPDERAEKAGSGHGGPAANGSDTAGERARRVASASAAAAAKPTRLDNAEPGPGAASGGSAPGRELLVGPFKSEAEAPATITLSGVLYQKSGAKGPPPAAQLAVGEQENLSGGRTPVNNWPAPSQQQQQPQTSAIFTSAPPTPQISVLLGRLKSNLEFQQPPRQLIEAPDAKELMQTMDLSLEPYYAFGGFRPAAAAASGAELNLLGPPKELKAKMNGNYQAAAAAERKQPAGAPSTTSALRLASPSAATTVIVGGAAADELPIWAASNNKAEQYYLAGSAGRQQDSYQMAGSAKQQQQHKASGPIVIVQKDVKPVKYHLLRAYLKLRRLLRPFEATYVFPNDSSSFLRRRRRSGAAGRKRRLA